MSPETVFFDLAAADAGVRSAFGGPPPTLRIYPGGLPEGCAYPAGVFSRTATEYLTTIHGTVLAVDGSLAVQAWAENRTAANNAADALESALIGAGYPPESRTDVADPETGLEGVELLVTLLINR